MRGFRDTLAKAGQNMAAIKIQKYLKGMKVYKQFEPILIHNRLTKNFEYFDKIRLQQLTDSQIFIAWRWRIKLNLIKKKRERDAIRRQRLKELEIQNNE